MSMMNDKEGDLDDFPAKKKKTKKRPAESLVGAPGSRQRLHHSLMDQRPV